MDCVTPSHSTPIPHGESLDIYQLLNHANSKLELPPGRPLKSHWQYTTRKPVLGESQPNFEYLAAQITRGERRPSPKKPRNLKMDHHQRHADVDVFPPVGFLENTIIGTPQVARSPRPPAQPQSSFIKQMTD